MAIHIFLLQGLLRAWSQWLMILKVDTSLKCGVVWAEGNLFIKHQAEFCSSYLNSTEGIFEWEFGKLMKFPQVSV
jgi:hypothetical protein